MSDEPKKPGALALAWWGQNIEPRDSAAARGLVARLRRAAPIAVLSEPAVMSLAQSLKLGPSQAYVVVTLAITLAEVREHTSDTLAQRLGGDDPTLSTLRFQRLVRAEGAELTSHLRRSITMVDRRCNVAALAADILHWQAARPRWCFHYYGAEAPRKVSEEIPQ